MVLAALLFGRGCFDHWLSMQRLMRALMSSVLLHGTCLTMKLVLRRLFVAAMVPTLALHLQCALDLWPVASSRQVLHRECTRTLVNMMRTTRHLLRTFSSEIFLDPCLRYLRTKCDCQWQLRAKVSNWSACCHLVCEHTFCQQATTGCRARQGRFFRKCSKHSGERPHS